MFSFSKLAALLSVHLVLTSVLASPLLERATCTPNFEGFPQTIYAPVDSNLVNEWNSEPFEGSQIHLVQKTRSAAFAQGKFFVPFTGSPANGYKIKLVSDTARRLALTVTSDTSASFQVEAPTVISSQTWVISCQSCRAPGSGQTGQSAQSCTVSNPGTGKCLTGSDNGDILSLDWCDGSADQSYSFWATN